jgi:hypothetical protein
MKIGQKVFTTFQDKMNKKGVVCSELDGNFVSIQLDDSSIEKVELQSLIAYDHSSDLPEEYALPLALKREIVNSEMQLIRESQKTVALTSIFNGEGLPEIKRTYSGSKIYCEMLSNHFYENIKKLGYDSVNYIFS